MPKTETLIVLGKIYRYSGHSIVWKMINPNQTRLFNTRGRLVFEYPAMSDGEKGEYVEVFSGEIQTRWKGE